ncbi:MAG TPA: hypothetical protein VMH00_02935 [Candidatus Limnocylindrales bacterium]|nr:hypothetical protein [Candidatus Limnocylindrales bacterium]
MAQSILIFDFGTNEEAAQQARHKVDGWKQGFRLGNKLLLKFERTEEESASVGDGSAKKPDAAKKPASKKKAASKEEEEKTVSPARVRVFVRLDFSDHEKLSHQRWLDRIPTEEPFKSAKGETVRSSDATFSKTADLFDSLD